MISKSEASKAFLYSSSLSKSLDSFFARSALDFSTIGLDNFSMRYMMIIWLMDYARNMRILVRFQIAGVEPSGKKREVTSVVLQTANVVVWKNITKTCKRIVYWAICILSVSTIYARSLLSASPRKMAVKISKTATQM